MNDVKSILNLQIGDIKIRNSEGSIPGIIIAVYIFIRMCSPWKALISFVVSACPSVYLRVLTSLPLDGIPLNFILNSFMKNQLINSKFGQNLSKISDTFTWRP